MEFAIDAVPRLDAERPPGPPCVLVVDDDAVNLQLAWAMLTQWGVRAVLAEGGAEAIALALELRPDLILMDLQMPVLDGYEATGQIRRNEQSDGRARVPIVAYTANRMVDEKRLRLCGFDGVLHKPTDEPALVACLLRWCGAADP
jgi:CheY-like chemotaxis protein